MLNELKATLRETGNPFVWMNDAGEWWFHEQPNTTKFTAAEILGEVEKEAEPEIVEPEIPIEEPAIEEVKEEPVEEVKPVIEKKKGKR